MKKIRVPLEPELRGAFLPENAKVAVPPILWVEIDLPESNDVCRMVHLAMDTERVQNYEPWVILLGGVAYYALRLWVTEHGRRTGDGLVVEDTRLFCGVPFLLDDELPANAIRVLSSPRDQEAKFLRARVRKDGG